MIFVDSDYFMSFVGADHPRRAEARAFFVVMAERDVRLVTSAEVLRELLHTCLERDDPHLLEAALGLVDGTMDEVWPVERVDIELARDLSIRYPGLEARDLVHLACCIRREARALMTFDRGLAAAWGSRS